MSARTAVATANVLSTLDHRDGRKALGDAPALGPDLVGLQEWYPSPMSLLLETGQSATTCCAVGRASQRSRSCWSENRFLGLEPPRLVPVGVYPDRQLGGTVALADYKLVSGVQASGRFEDRAPAGGPAPARGAPGDA